MQLRHCCNHPFLIKGVVQAEGLEHADDATWLERLVQSSGKMALLDKLLPSLQQQGHRVLVFSQFKMLLDLIEDYVRLHGYQYERLDGSITGEARQAAIDRFSDDANKFLFLLGTRAGGVGINLVAADTVRRLAPLANEGVYLPFPGFQSAYSSLVDSRFWRIIAR